MGGYSSLHRPGSWFLQLPKYSLLSNVQKQLYFKRREETRIRQHPRSWNPVFFFNRSSRNAPLPDILWSPPLKYPLDNGSLCIHFFFTCLLTVYLATLSQLRCQIRHWSENDKLESMLKEADEPEFEILTQDTIRGSGIPVEINREYLPRTSQKRHNFSKFLWFTDIATCFKNKTLHENCLNTRIVYTDKVWCFMKNHRPKPQLFHGQGIKK